MGGKKRSARTGTGRPPSPLTATLPRVRVDPDDLAAWTKRAHADGRTLSGWIRHICNQAVGR